MISDYKNILSKLLSVNMMGGMKLGLKNCQDIDKLLNFPSQAFSSIHIAGTNGKGSVSTKIAAAHQSLGLKTGLYTSPHIACFRERIRINGEMISEEQVLKHLTTLFAVCDEHNIKATFFELTTMLAFLHFAAEKVDVAVLETGLGGRLDATNISKPFLSIITTISLEHTEILGETIEAITNEKAGIIKPNTPVIIGPRVPKSLIEQVCLENGCEWVQVLGPFQDYHTENCAIAKEALEWLKISPKAIEEGLKVLPPCRLEILTKPMLQYLGHSSLLPEAIILDVAHNPDGLKELLKAIRNRYPKHALRFVIGLSSNKDIQSCLNIIKDEATGFHFIEGSNERAASKEKLAEQMVNLGVSASEITCEPNIASAIQHAIHTASKNDEIVVVCGTFFIMGQARQALGINEPQDPTDMNER